MKFKITESNVYHEAGVDYMTPPVLQDELYDGGWMHFVYNWFHVPSGKKGTHSIYIHHADELDKLLNHWNESSDDWKFTR